MNVKIIWENYSNWSELSRILGNSQGQFDLLCIHSFLAADMIQSGWMDEFEYRNLSEIRNLSPEFQQMSFDKNANHFVPIGWMVNAYMTEASKEPPRWSQLWPAQASQITLSYPDLEIYWRMRQEGLEMDPEKQGRYNTDPEGFVKKFVHQLGGIRHPNEKLKPEDLKGSKIVQMTNGTWSNLEDNSIKEKFRMSELSDGVSVWFLLTGVGKNSQNKELSRKVISELLSSKVSNDLRIQRGFAHVLSPFDDAPDVPAEMKASFIRTFPLRSLKFPDVSLEGLSQWESLMKKSLAKPKDQLSGTK